MGCTSSSTPAYDHRSRHRGHRSSFRSTTHIPIGMVLELYGPKDLHTMATILHLLLTALGRFERWFDGRFGWFFTNGMKEHHQQGGPSFRA